MLKCVKRKMLREKIILNTYFILLLISKLWYYQN
jgi:hypothetical protein